MRMTPLYVVAGLLVLWLGWTFGARTEGRLDVLEAQQAEQRAYRVKVGEAFIEVAQGAMARDQQLDACRLRTDSLRELLEVLVRIVPGWAHLPDPPPTTGWPAWPEPASFRWDYKSLRTAGERRRVAGEDDARESRGRGSSAQGDGPWSAGDPGGAARESLARGAAGGVR